MQRRSPNAHPSTPIIASRACAVAIQGRHALPPLSQEPTQRVRTCAGPSHMTCPVAPTRGALHDLAERSRRRALLALPRMVPLAFYAAGLRRSQAFPGVQVPDFDPLDGGIGARVLFVLEKPGPGILPDGFVSRDNGTPTAAAIRAFMAQAGLPRGETVLWNLVPWWNGTTAVTAAERAAGLAELEALLPLLPALDTAVLVGRTAGAAREILGGLRVLESAHPSPQVRAGFRDRWDEIPRVWTQAARPGAEPS